MHRSSGMVPRSAGPVWTKMSKEEWVVQLLKIVVGMVVGYAIWTKLSAIEALLK